MTQSETRVCQNCKASFVIDVSDFAFYERIQVPPPTWCPECRLQRRLAFLNERSLYKRKCDMCGESVVSMYSPEKKVLVYCSRCWWSDKWDGTQYASEYDPSRTFFEQVKELRERTPQMALESNYLALERSEYVNYASTCKNCYLVYVADRCENVLYSEMLLDDKDSMDCTMYRDSELCYGLINSSKCYRVFFSEDCENCQELCFSKDCNGCSNCFGCVGLRNKRYHIFNKPCTKEEYREELSKFDLGSHGGLEKSRERALEFWRTFPRKFSHALRNLNVTGDYIYESKNSRDMYVVHSGAEDCRYCQLITMSPVKDAYDYTGWGNNAQRIYEATMAGEGADNIKFSYEVWPNVLDIEYSMFIISSSHMLGCSSMRNKEYCVLNKQYTREGFEAIREKIIDDMNRNPHTDAKGRVYRYGEFFPPELSLFGYNESYAMNFFPLSREEAREKGFYWCDEQPGEHRITMEADDVPDSIDEVPDSILDQVIGCASCARPFRVISVELELLRRFKLPVPRKCPNCRYRERWSRVNQPFLRDGICQCGGKKSENGIYSNTVDHFHGADHCPNKFRTSYAPERKEIVYCEQCYQREVV